MLEDTIPLSRILDAIHTGIVRDSLNAFIAFLEKRLNGRMVVNSDSIPYRRNDLLPLIAIAGKLREAGVIKNFYTFHKYPDEPLQYNWVVECATPDAHRAGGMSAESDEAALTAAIAEALERYLWFTQTDFHRKPLVGTVDDLVQRKVVYVDPTSFVGFTEAQRMGNPRLTITSQTTFHWTEGYSWTSAAPVYLPSQLVSSARIERTKPEPLILVPITTGLATWPTRVGAVLSGTMEIVERDAFMITWLNQLPLPRLPIDEIAAERPSLARLISRCRRYRITPHAVRLPTDAPAYAVCGSVTDDTGNAPAYMIGLKAHRNLARAVEGALLEALRMRQAARSNRETEGSWDESRDIHLINHLERTSYWTEPSHAKHMQFLTGLPQEILRPHESWDFDTDESHFARVLQWAKERHYKLASVALGTSKKNVTPWHVEMVVMPDLQPMHQNERYPYLGGVRLTDIPAQFGYQARRTPFNDLPHPFA